MSNFVPLTYKSDSIGALASTFCFLHCLTAPLIFVGQAGLATGEEVHPWWWGTLDIFFLTVSFFAVYWSAKNSIKPWVKYAFWVLWMALALLIVNEKLEIAHLMEELIYLPTIGLIALHIYNRHDSNCKDKSYCIHD